jgi:Asp/Glu/hydantoin racemase
LKILWQSYTEPGTRFLAVLQQYLQSVVSPGIEVHIAGLQPADGHVHRLSELRCAYQVVAQNADAAERGYDAVVVGHFQDGGVHELRSLLDIPVVGLGECAMHTASQLGERFGLVTINPGFLAFHREQVRGYGLQAKFAGVRAMGTDAPTYQRAFNGELDRVDFVAEEFRRCALELVALDADVIIPAGGFPALLLRSYGRVPDLGGAAVLDPVGLAVGQAELWARLGRDRVSPGRGGVFARPDAGVVAELVSSLAATAPPPSSSAPDHANGDEKVRERDRL